VVVLMLELRVLCLLGRCSTTWATSSGHFSNRALLFAQAVSWTTILSRLSACLRWQVVSSHPACFLEMVSYFLSRLALNLNTASTISASWVAGFSVSHCAVPEIHCVHCFIHFSQRCCREDSAISILEMRKTESERVWRGFPSPNNFV
jgi:hypothetical protein